MLANTLFFHLARPRAQQARAIKVADHLLWFFAVDDRAARPISCCNMRHHGVVREFVGIRDDRRLRSR